MNPGKNFHIIENMYYLCILIAWCAIGILAISVFFVGILFLGEKLFPEKMHAYNYTLSTRTFDELKANRHYHAAINFMEYKQVKLLRDDPMSITYLQELCDCYMRVGDYSKAEKILLELYKDPVGASDALKDEYDENDELLKTSIVASRWSFAQELFKVYDLMENKEGKLKAYRMMQEVDSVRQQYMELMKDKGEKTELLEMGIAAMNQLMSFYRLEAKYEENPNAAIDSLKTMLDSLADFQAGIMTRYRNRLVGWMLEQNRLFDAYGELAIAVKSVDAIPDRHKFEYYGDLIDYCLQLHDYETGRRLLEKYWHHVRRQYEPQDMEYIRTQIRELRFLEKEGRWDDIESKISDICRNLQAQIEKNFIGMSEDQREFFARQIDEPFSYAIKVLQLHPTSRMAALCFGNQVFRKGLLLRSSQILRNTIAKSGDAKLVAEYDSMVKMKKELGFREYLSADPRNALRMRELKLAIEELDKSIALGCADYTRLSDTHSLDYKEIQHFLEKDEVLLELVDGGGQFDRTLFAIILGSKGAPEYVPLCSLSDISNILRRTNVDDI